MASGSFAMAIMRAKMKCSRTIGRRWRDWTSRVSEPERSMELDLLIHNGPLATMRDASGYGVIEDGAIGIRAGRIAFVGARSQLPREATSASGLDLAGR